MDFPDLFDEEFELNDLPEVNFSFEEEDGDDETLGLDRNLGLPCDERTIPPRQAITSIKNGVASVASNNKKKGTNGKENKETKVKENKKPRKKAVDRPKMTFTKEDAVRNATTYIKAALLELIGHPMYKKTFPLAVAALTLATALLGLIATPIFQSYSIGLVTDIWIIITAGDKKKLKPEAHELVYRQFHLYLTCDSTRQQWTNFNQTLNLVPNDHVHHFLLRTVLKNIMTDRHMVDLPEKCNEIDNPFNKNIEEVIRYTAGYIPYALHKRYSHVKGETAKAYCAVLTSWKVKGTENPKTFLEYTNGWFKKQTRGGLFEIDDTVYLFFRTLELETRKHLSITKMDTMPNRDIKSCIMKSISEKLLVHTYWCKIVDNKLVGDISKNLLDVVVRLWIKIRTNAFLKVYLDLKRAEGKKITEKSAKALRKDL